MLLKYAVFLLVGGAMFCAAARAEDKKPGVCPTENPCHDLNNSCKCYCSHECGPRDKKKDEDDPVFVPNDPHGNFCYCKQWDKDEFEKRCKVKAEDKKDTKEENKQSNK